MKNPISNYLDDILFFTGIAMLTIGLFQIAPKAALLFIGAILLIGGIWVGWIKSTR